MIASHLEKVNQAFLVLPIFADIRFAPDMCPKVKCNKEHFMKRVTSRNGEHTIETAANLGIGVNEYELIEI
ncbi:MAG: hypothetical protein IJ736_05635 [Firmicutes bacterium]|nr:hypothetical protein [Bacillota bacterium]